MSTGYELKVGENKEPGSNDVAVRYVDEDECAALFLSDGSHVGNDNALMYANMFIEANREANAKEENEDDRTIEILQHNISYWYNDDMEMPESEQDYVRHSIEQGCNRGQLVYEEDEKDMNTGWWKIDN